MQGKVLRILLRRRASKYLADTCQKDELCAGEFSILNAKSAAAAAAAADTLDSWVGQQGNPM
jgi:hypothetical protein